MHKPIRVVLVEDHALVRAGLRALLRAHPDIVIVAEAGDGPTAIDAVLRFRPNVVLLDVRLGASSGLDVAVEVREHCPETRVLIVSMHAEEEYVLHALRIGAAGYLLKDSSPAELTQAIQTVDRGEVYLSPVLSQFVAAAYARKARGESGPAEPLQCLSPRQKEVLRLIAGGHGTQEIAHLLFVSPKTVETHRRQIMERLDIHDVAGLVRFAIRTGLAPLEEEPSGKS